MINSNGVIQNNKTASDFIRKQRKLNKVYKILSKDEERDMIEGYARLKLTDGKPTWNDKFECDFEWVGPEAELREKLAMHNLQAVTRISSKHCQDTTDYDNMYAKGLYGLTKAANDFHPFKIVTRKEGDKRKIVYGPNGELQFIKFSTFAWTWVFKYVMDEFYLKSRKIDNNSTSINELVNMHNAANTKMTFENYLYSKISPEIPPQQSVDGEISAGEATTIMENLQQYISTSTDISSLERGIIEETLSNEERDGKKFAKKLSKMFNVSLQDIEQNQASAYTKLREYLHDEYGIDELSDII